MGKQEAQVPLQVIEGVRLQVSHVGRRVVYTGMAGEHEIGRISSWNEHVVFVKYGQGDTATPTDPADLSWEAVP